MRKYYTVDGNYWDTGRAAWIAPDDPDFVAWRAEGNLAIEAKDEKGMVTLNGLRQTLEFYGLPLGKLKEVTPPTEVEIQAAFTNAIQTHLDAFARTRNYDGILSAATYATSKVVRFAKEGQMPLKPAT